MEIAPTDQWSLSNSKETGKVNRKIVCWIGNAPNHKALVHFLAERFEVAGVIIDRKATPNKKRNLAQLPGLVYDKWRFRKIDKAWKNLQDYYRKYAEIPKNIPVLELDTINDLRALEFTTDLQPELVVVSGTSMIREPLLSIPLPIGIMNLHTGLSPYVKGGPNCTNWCIANGDWELIGNTVMWIAAGIDSGNIIATERTDISSEKDLKAIHLKVMQHAHDLYMRCIAHILESQPPYPSVPQNSIDKGKVYLTKMWTAAMKKQLLKNLDKGQSSDKGQAIRTISLPH